MLPYIIDQSLEGANYLSEGILEEFIEAFSNRKGLQVCSRSTSIYLATNPILPKNLKEELNIDYMVEGALKVRGDDLELVTRLVDTALQEVVVSSTVSIDLDNWVDKLTEPIDDLLFVLIEGYTKLKSAAPISKAQGLYRKGMYHWNRYTHDEMLLGIGCFKEAVKEDPCFAPAYAAMADCYCVIALMGFEAPIPRFEKAKEYVVKALELNNKHSESYVAAGMINMFYDHDLSKAEANLKLAFKLNKSNLKVRHMLSVFNIFIGNIPEAKKHSLFALKNDPLSVPYYAMMARLSCYTKNFDEALDYINGALNIDPESAEMFEIRGWIYTVMGNMESAIADLKLAIKYGENIVSYGMLCFAYDRSSFRYESRELEEEFEGTPKSLETGIYNYAKAMIHLGREDYDGFFKYLDIALKKKLSMLMWDLRVNPIYNNIRKDQRFQDALNAIIFTGDNHVFISRKPSTILTIQSKTKEKLVLDPQDILFAKASDNYCTIYWYEQDVLKNKLLRITITELHEQLKAFEDIIRCHKSYIIQLSTVLTIGGNAKGYYFESAFLPLRIPISRAKSDEVNRQLAYFK